MGTSVGDPRKGDGILLYYSYVITSILYAW